MKTAEMLDKLSTEYKRCHHVYASLEKQAQMFLEKGDMAAYQRMTARAANRAATLTGIKRAAVALGIKETALLTAAGFETA